jgi:hypothetical protein
VSGSFTLTGQILHHDKVTPFVDAPINITAVTYKDTADKVVYTGTTSLVTDASGAFSIVLLTETGLVYTVTSGSEPALFTPVTVPAQTAASTHDLTEF